jgi:TP901 family phage tail tape measure protein
MIIRTLEALFTLKTNATEFRKATKEVDKFADNANKVLKAVAGHFVVQAITGFITETANAMADIGKTSGYLGIATSALQEMRYAAEKSGVTIDTLGDSLKELQIRAVDSLSGSGEAFDAFNKLKINPKNALGHIREPLDMLDEVADKLNKLPTQSERIWVVDSMFGDQGAMMLKMLKGGSQGLSQMRAKARSLGHVLDGEAIAKAEKFNQELKRMKFAFSGVVDTLIQGIMPALTKAMEKWGNLSIKMQDSNTISTILRLGIIALGEGLVFLAIKAGLAFAAIGRFKFLAGFVLVALTFIIEDLWKAFDGGDSYLKSAYQRCRAWGKSFEDWFYGLVGDLWAMFIGLAQKIPDLLSNMLPDFLKNGFSATVKNVGKIYHQMEPVPLHSRLAPAPPSIANQNRLTSTQNVNVAVNVKTGADPQAIGGEVSKAVRAELEKERFNTLMGVSQYAN